MEELKIIRGKAPLRVTFAGGGTDLNYFFEQHGGLIISSTIDKYCHMSLSRRDDKKMFVNKKELDKQKEHIVREVVDYLAIDFGFDLTYYNDVAPGSGLGNSSAAIVLLVTLLSEIQNKKYDDNHLVEIAFEIEKSLGEGGWQDQFSSVYGGFNLMEFDKEKKTIYPIRLKYRTICELEEHLILYELEQKHKSSSIQEEQIKHIKNTPESLIKLLEVKEIARDIKNALLNNKVSEIGILLDKAWELKRNKVITNETIDRTYEIAKENGAIGGKLLGAGQGGHILFFCKPEDRVELINKLELMDGKVTPFHFWIQGVETWY